MWHGNAFASPLSSESTPELRTYCTWALACTLLYPVSGPSEQVSFPNCRELSPGGDGGTATVCKSADLCTLQLCQKGNGNGVPKCLVAMRVAAAIRYPSISVPRYHEAQYDHSYQQDQDQELKALLKALRMRVRKTKAIINSLSEFWACRCS